MARGRRRRRGGNRGVCREFKHSGIQLLAPNTQTAVHIHAHTHTDSATHGKHTQKNSCTHIPHTHQGYSLWCLCPALSRRHIPPFQLNKWCKINHFSIQSEAVMEWLWAFFPPLPRKKTVKFTCKYPPFFSTWIWVQAVIKG